MGAGALGAASLAWFAAPKTQVETDGINGIGTGSYFAGGDGSKDDPYQIKTAKQLYYFNWLQDLGYFNKYEMDESGKETTTIDQTYFILTDDIDASGYVLPPAGTKTYPFLGNFNGDKHTINNLSISNSVSKLAKSGIPKGAKTSDGLLDEAEIVGFFGIVGEWGNSTSYTFSSEVNGVSDLYFDKLLVNSNSSSTLSGLLAGYVNGNMSHCGVRSGKLTYASGASPIKDSTFGSDNTKLSKYSLIGDYNESSFTWEGKGGASSDTGYGTSTDIKALHKSLIDNGLSDGSAGKIKSSYAIPFRYENTTLINGTDETIAMTVYTSMDTGISKTQSINPSNYYTYEASHKGNNLGYYIGEVKTYEKSLDYSIDDFGVQSGSGYSITNRYLKAPPDDVLSYLKTNGTHVLRLNNGYSSDNLSGSTFTYVENGRVGSTYEGPLILPSNGIWVAPKENGTFKFVFYNDSYKKGGQVGILFMEFQRVTPGDYSSPFKRNYLQGSGLSYSCKYGYFEKTAYVGYEYYITFYNTSSYDAPYIAYMDIGADAGSGEDTSKVTPTIDFVYYKTGTNEIMKIDEEGYANSKITFALTSGVTSVCFWRVNDNGTILMYYYTASTASIAPEGNGSASSGKEEDYTSN